MKAMRILVVENWPNATLGLLAGPLVDSGADIHLLQTHRGDAVPGSADGFDALVLLGGAQDALDDAGYPYLAEEVRLVRAFAQEDRAVLGICLGAQLVARACGAENVLGRPIEFGWQPVHLTQAGQADPVLSAMEGSAPLFHWHVDTFTLPPGAVHLAASDMTPVQAFRVGRAVYGIQFHFEVDTGMVTRWNAAFEDEIVDFDPGWFKRHPAEAARHGPAADAAGLAIARAWVALAAHSPTGEDKARTDRTDTLPEVPA
jgi:GMP synthase-like glutamine amidotransferase